MPGLCPLHDMENLTGDNCEECDRILDCVDDETDNFHDDGNDYICELCDSKFEWPCQVYSHVQEHFQGKSFIILKISVADNYDKQIEEENVKNVIKIQEN